MKKGKSAAERLRSGQLHVGKPEHVEDGRSWERMKAQSIPVNGDALLELWRRWAGAEKPPRQSLMGDLDRLPIDIASMNREYIRASLDLERHARKRLKILDDAAARKRKVAPYCQIYLSHNKMVAWAFVFPPSEPGMPISVDQIGRAMKEHGVESGIDPAMVARLFLPEYYFQMTPIALGKPASPPVQGKVLDRFPRKSAAAVEVDGEGNLDYRTRKQFQMVRKGEEICGIDPGRAGKAGFRVDGGIIEAGPVPPLPLPQGRNTVVSRNGRRLVSAIDGTLDFRDGRFHVRPVLEIRGDVAAETTGDVDFYGDIHITGNVREKMVVRAAGDLIIDGLMEAAVVEAGGNIMITRGVLGNYRGIVKSSGGSVQAKYLENCEVYAQENVAAECIMVSQIFANGTIQVTGGRGMIIGGELAAGTMVRARIIGSQAGRDTLIKLGGKPLWGEEVRRNEEELTAVRKEIFRADDELERLMAEAVCDDGAALKQAHRNKSVLTLREMQLRQRRDRLSRGEEPDVRQCRLEAGLVYPPTTVTVGVRPLRIGELVRFCHIRYDPELGDIRKY